PKIDGLKSDSSIWIEDDNNDKNKLNSPSHRHAQYKKSKQAKSAEKGFEEPQLAPSHIEPISPPSPATLTSDSSASNSG
ncbi:8630_t:CDS:1, partial [Paraglomus brasilianum]